MDNSQAKRETFPKRDFYSEASFRAYDRSLIVVMLQCMQNSEGNNARQRKSTFFLEGGGIAKIMRLQHHYNLSIQKFTIKDWYFDNLILFWAMEAFRYSNPCYTSSQS
jgi:uncharacterized protein YkuJ